MSETTRTPVYPPAGAFLRGALVGIGVVLPLVILVVFGLSRIGIGDPATPFVRVVELALMFAALPAALTAGGVARFAGREALLSDEPSVAVACKAGAKVFAPAGVGLVLLTALPLGKLPEQSWLWIWIAVVGALTGALAGVAIGRVAMGRVAAPPEEPKETDDEAAG